MNSAAWCRFVAEGHVSFQPANAGRDNTARQLLDVLEEIHAATPFQRRRIGFAPIGGRDGGDHRADQNARRRYIVCKSRMALTGERNIELWGLEKARNAPPLRTMIESRYSVGARAATAFARRVIRPCSRYGG